MIAVIGCGNPARSDDGLGSFVARALSQDPRFPLCPSARVFDAGTDGMSVMFSARGVDRLIIVDAACAGGVPGTIYRVPGEVMSASHPPSLNLHDFRWEHALFAGRQIFGKTFPKVITVYLVEAGSLDFGLELTPAVERAAKIVVGEILGILAGHEARCTVIMS